MNKPLIRSTSIGSAFNKGMEIYKENFALVFLAFLLAAIISAFSITICMGPMICGVFGIILALLRKQVPKPEVGRLFDGFQKFVNAFVPALLFLVIIIVFGLIIALILYCLLGIISFIPIIGTLIGFFGFFLSPLLSLLISLPFTIVFSSLMICALYLVQDQDATIGEAISRPFQMLGDKRFWSIILVDLVACPLGAVGLLACGIGVLFTAPFAFCMITAAFEEVFSDPTQTTPTDETPAASPESPEA